MNRFIRLHPVRATVIGVSTSLLLIILCIYGGMKINKHIHPNDIYYGEEGFICKSTVYTYSLNSNWEFTERPTELVGVSYSGKYGLFPSDEIFKYKDDPEAMFIKAQAEEGEGFDCSLYYMKKENNINLYDNEQIGKIVLQSQNKNNESIELTESKTISECLTYLKDVKDEKYAQSDKTPGWDKKFDLYLYLKEYPVRYHLGQFYMNNSEDIWMFDSNRASSPVNYEIPKELKAQMENEIKK